jgi:hypothetical protein
MTAIHKSNILSENGNEKARKACAKRAPVSPSIILNWIFLI